MCPFQHELPVPRSRGDDEGRPLEFALRGLEMVTVVGDHDVAGRLKYVFINSFSNLRFLSKLAGFRVLVNTLTAPYTILP